MKLNPNAVPFYPSVQWVPVITEEYYEQRPHSPGSDGFVIADQFFNYHEIPDEELFDPKMHPLTEQELAELEQIDEINELLAELDIMETHQELHHKLAEFTKEKRVSSDFDAEIHNLMTKSAKKDRVKAPHVPKKQLHCHAKQQKFVPLLQPRSVN
ncbi:hypothetical protein Poli38472_001389 [Pythium oligandrum]|uniref:Ataxin-2 C-terminal domain-containing protein n=1 Tax=Pythium oligandrum TaxID=41045 RepID=A0A8K1CVX7_PYTOL|nr:hypothetical protein Poli38472_001389 [Pythium oligandrum]|eukprot:TMW69233.1 hypothetical protein Poli38472_001389 [Pythium oligandrum]